VTAVAGDDQAGAAGAVLEHREDAAEPARNGSRTAPLPPA